MSRWTFQNNQKNVWKYKKNENLIKKDVLSVITLYNICEKFFFIKQNS